MFDFSDYAVYKIINILGVFIGMLFGAMAQKNQYCFSGAIKDYILTSSTKRAASVVVSMISTVLFTQIIASIYGIDLGKSHYFFENINYFSIVLGGLLFGTGMMLADGCVSRNLVKFAQGDVRSLVTLVFVALFALATTKGFLYGSSSWLTSNDSLVLLSSYIGNVELNIFLLLSFLIIILYLLTKSFKRLLLLYDGVLIGFLIALTWFVTYIGSQESLERVINLSSLSFVYPSAKTLEYFSFYESNNLSFGISTVIGVLLGAFLMSKKNKKYSFGCTSQTPKSDIKKNMIGGALMGVGGILAVGCTVGQGLSGLSTLALSSFLAICSIMFSGYLTAKYMNAKDMLPACFIFQWKLS